MQQHPCHLNYYTLFCLAAILSCHCPPSAEAFSVPFGNILVPHPIPNQKNGRCSTFELCGKPRSYTNNDDDEEDEASTMSMRNAKFVGDSEAARELKGLPYEEEEENYLDDDDDDDDEQYKKRSIQPRSRNTRRPTVRDQEEYEYENDYEYEYEDDDSDYDDDDDDDNDDDNEVPGGNFWSNPNQGLDRTPSQQQRRPSSSQQQQQQQTQRKRTSRSTAAPRQREPRKRSKGGARTTFRSSTPSIPNPVSDFYDKLFWYGFREYDTTSTSDKTMFGGTKGKFNGLELLQEGINDNGRSSSGRPSGRRRRRRDDAYDDEYDATNDDYDDDNDDDDDDNDDDDDYSDDRRPRQRQRQRPRQRSSRRSKDDWVSEEVSNWFTSEEEEPDRRKERTQRRNKSDSPLSLLVSKFLKIDDDADYKAEMYERQLGKRNQIRPRPQREDSESQRRAGYAYRYVNDDPSPPIDEIDYYYDDEDRDTLPMGGIDAPEIIGNGDGEAKDGTRRNNATAQPPEEVGASSQRRKLTWEERAQAVERIPPSGVPAWGPSGDVGMDARTKATLDALEEIRDAKQKLEIREEREIEAKENMIIVRADAELQKKRLLANDRARNIRPVLRQIDTEVDDASMDLRRAKAQTAVARDQLAELEELHWAVLSLYDAEKAFTEVEQMIQEIKEGAFSNSVGTHEDGYIRVDNSETDSLVEKDQQSTLENDLDEIS